MSPQRTYSRAKDGSIEALQTPEVCFSKIKDFPYEPKYLKSVVGGLRLAYYDVPSTATGIAKGDNEPVFLCLHGEPSWSYLYRHMIPVFRQRGRVICIDLLGFGRSDKPIHREDYTYSLHRTALLSAVNKLDLTNITLVVQDWGGQLGLSLPLESPSRYNRLIVMNTGLPVEPESYKTYLEVQYAKKGGNTKSGFGKWFAFSQKDGADINVGKVMRASTGGQMSRDVVAAYDAPYPSPNYKMGAMIFPALVPFSAHQPKNDGYVIGRQALDFFRYHWGNRPIFMACGALDPVIPPRGMMRLRSYLTNDGQNAVCNDPLILKNAGHFVQEQAGKEVAEKALAYFDQYTTPLSRSKL